ncbi:MAG: TRAP transporter substrate-binding protein [Betaproteobacteria bacterium]|nr:TRAP transporter substrate-binding protein [Betaproteobacteria bacterium]
MNNPIQIRMGGYGPATTTCSRGLKVMGDRLEAEFGKDVDIKYVWNVMDLGYKGGDLLWMAEHGILTLAYQSTSYLADRVPELEFADLPFLFGSLEEARAAMEGELGAYLSRKIEERIGYRLLGYFENGYRHLSNRLRTVRTPADVKGMRIRLMPGRIHQRSFELLGAVPFSLDLKPGLEAIVSGAVDAQENPLANTVDYGAHKVHRYHTLTGHCYLSRGIYMNRTAFDGWPEWLQTGMMKAAREAIIVQRQLAVEEEEIARRAIESAGGEIVELTPDEREAFVRAVKPLHDETRARFGDEMFALLPRIR